MERDKDFYTKEYTNSDKSARKLAAELGMSTGKLLRELKSLKIPIKDKSQVQKGRLKTVEHPTAGKKRTEAEKVKIGKGVAGNWSTMTKDQVKKRIKGNLLDFSTMPKHEQDVIRKKAHVAIKQAAKRGSKMERFFHEKLIAAGYKVTPHKEIPLKEKLIVDLMLTEHNIVIEVDGVSHREAVWGADKLKQQQTADKEKNGILVSCGYIVIRFRLAHRNYNLTKSHAAFASLKAGLDKVLVEGKKARVVHLSD